MAPFTDLLAQGTAQAWLFVPSAILLGALHGLEPGHSKTMMAAFIVAVRGTVTQAVLLGLAATLSHTALVWAIALAGQSFGRSWGGAAAEPYFQLASAVLIIGIALWMLARTWHERRTWRARRAHHDHHHDHAHHHHGHPEPEEEDAHTDAHARAHADDIRRRFTGRPVTTAQIVMFGLTGGLIPCPAAITVLLLCIQLEQVSLGFVLVVCFSIGLALTMVSAGVLAALGARHVASRWSGFATLARRAPYASAGLIILVGLYTGWLGWDGLRHGPAAHAKAPGISRAS